MRDTENRKLFATSDGSDKDTFSDGSDKDSFSDGSDRDTLTDADSLAPSDGGDKD